MHSIFINLYLQSVKLKTKMRSKYLLLALISVFLWGCGEAGVESDISKLIDTERIEINLSTPFVGQEVDRTPSTIVYARNVVESDEFSEYLDDAQNFTVNFITYSVEGFPTTSSADMVLDVSVSIQGGNFLELLSLRINDVQNNPQDIMIYEKGSDLPANESTVSQLENALLNGQTFDMKIELYGEDVTLEQADVAFDLIFKYDLTARVQFD